MLCGRVFLLLTLLSVSLGLQAQDRQVTGKVVGSSDGQGIPGANVIVKGTQTGTSTDGSGNFRISVKNAGSVLIISSIGYTRKEIAVGNQSTISVSLDEEISSLSEVVVTGYGSQSKRDITGAVATIDAKTLLSTPSTNLGQAMQGRVAGVTVGNENSPGGGVMVRIRGFGTINDNSPLYVIDGTPTKGNLNTLNLNDIENMQVLKDASAASIYGSRAGNGVVIITTKKGKPGKPKFTYDVYYGNQTPGKTLDLLNTQEYANLLWEQRTNSLNLANLDKKYWADGNTPLSGLVDGKIRIQDAIKYPTHSQFGSGATPTIPYYIFPSGGSQNDPRADPSLYNIDPAKPFYLITRANPVGTNWFNEIFSNAPIQNHQLGVSGGNENGRYAMSLNYFDQKGIMNYTSFKRYSFRVNTEFNVSKRIRVGESFQVAFGERVGQPNGNNFENNPVSFAYRIQPIIPVYDVMGNFAGTRGGDLDNALNPVALLYRNQDNVNKEVRLFGNAYAEVDILKNLTARTQFGIDYNNANARIYTIRDVESSEARGSNLLSTTNGYEYTWTWYNTLSYNTSFGNKHKLNVILGTESIKNYFEQFDASRTDFKTDALDNRYLAAGTGVQTNNSTASNWQLASEFAKVNYSLANKYLFDVTLRRDRSSRFAADYRAAYFPAVSAGWRFTEEPFMKQLGFLDEAKLRVGWGQTGNQEIGNYNPYTQFSLNPATSFYDLTGSRSSAVAGYELTQFGNAKAKWETTTSTNIGLDAVLLKGKLDVALDWYNRVTSDMLFPVPAPATAGVATVPFQNIGEMRNRGIDLGINYHGKVGEVSYSIGANFGTYRNLVTKTNGDPKTQYFGLNDQRITNFVVTQQGYPISSFYGYIIDGIFQSDAEGKAYAPQFGSSRDDSEKNTENRAGRFKFRDVNGDGKIDSGDLTVIGSPHPDFNYGINVSASYKNFTLTLFGQGVYGNQIFNYVKYWTDFPTFQGNRSRRMLEQSWRPGKTDAILPQPRSSDQISIQPSTYYLESGSYFRVKNIQLTYRLPEKMLSKLGVSGASVYVQGQNLFTVTNYSGMDPEINLRNYSAGNDRQIGVDEGAYPVAKTFLVGLNLSF